MEKKIFDIFTGINFGLVCACMFIGRLNGVISTFILICWTFVGYMKGRMDECDKDIDRLEAMIEKLNQMIDKEDK